MGYFGRLSGAEGETRTPTPERELDPEPSVSTNSTTSARKEVIKDFRRACKYFSALAEAPALGGMAACSLAVRCPGFQENSLSQRQRPCRVRPLVAFFFHVWHSY